MWIREQLEGREPGKALSRGRAVSSGQEMMIAGEENLRSPEVLAPYGFYFVIPAGQTVITQEGKVLGIPMTLPEGLQEGELLIRNAFGAEIELKKDGSVIINGQKFERSEG